MKRFRTVDEFLSALPKPVRERVEGLRKIIRQAASRAEETISYNMPAFKQNGMLVWYAGFKTHIGFYPRPRRLEPQELASYKTSKGATQFPMEAPIPAALVKKIVKFRLNENERQKRQKR